MCVPHMVCAQSVILLVQVTLWCPAPRAASRQPPVLGVDSTDMLCTPALGCTGALALFNDKQGGHAELYHAIIANNSADQGGGIRVTAVPLDGNLERLNDYYAGAPPALIVRHSRLANNRARSGSGGGNTLLATSTEA